ncbi:hypothetical protein UlMin_028716 [Ulmus minor]
MAAASRTIELTVLSAENLRLNRRLIKKNAFVIVRTDRNNFRTTEIDAEGGSYPKWNQKLVLEIPVQARSVTVEVHCKTAFGYRVIGTAIVPVSDFFGGCLPENYLHFLSYRLRDYKGERNGIVNISVRLKVSSPVDYCRETYSGYSSCSNTTKQVAVGVPVGAKEFGGNGIVVTGVPLKFRENKLSETNYLYNS